MKVRIKKAPQMMAYGGQKKHSLDIVRTTIDDYKPDYNDVETRNTRGADPRDESTVEVEGGEEIKYTSGQLQKAVGPNHNPNPNKEGGVPMNLPEGSFVFSKRKLGGMGVKGSELKNFGKSENDKKTYSFAELASQYRPNTYYDMLMNDRADSLQKRTAAAMIQKYDDKLADLALLQESKKGFPQGIPDIAKEKFAKMQQYMQQAEQQEQQMPMAMYGYNMNNGGFIPDYSSISDMYRYQKGGSTDSQDEQIAQYIQAYAQLSQKDPQEIYQALQSLPPAQQQEALQNIVQTVQQVMSQQQGGGDEEQQMAQDDSGYYSAPGGEPQYAMQQPSEQEAQQMRNGGSYSGTYYQGTYFANGGAFVPTYGDSSYNEQFGGQMVYDNDYGMLPRAYSGKEVDPPIKKVKKSEIAKYEKEGWTKIPGTSVWKKETPSSSRTAAKVIKGKPAIAGSPGSPGLKRKPKVTEAWLRASPAERKRMSKAAQEKWEREHPEAKATPPVQAQEGTKDTYECPPGYTFDDKTKDCVETKIIPDYLTYEESPYAPPQPGSVTPGKFGYGNYGIPPESWLGIGAAAAYPPIYIRPFYDEPQGVIPRPTFYYPQRELASAQETARGLEQMGSIMNPQTAGAMASFIQANAAKTAADTLGRYQNLNVGVANQFSPLQAQIANSLFAQKREAKDKRYAGEAVALQQYNNAMRQYATNLAKVTGEGMQAGKKQGQMYDASPYFTTDRFGRLRLKPGVDASEAIMGTTAGRNSSNTSSNFLKEYEQLKGTMDKDALNQYLKIKYGSGSSKRSSSDDDDVAYGYGQSAYPFA